MDSQTLELLMGSPDTTSDFGSSLGAFLLYITIASVVVTGAILVMWIMAQMRRRKVENATLEIRDILHEMNERDKQRTAPQPTPTPSAAPVAPPKAPQPE